MGKGLAILGVPVMGRQRAFSPTDIAGLALWLDASDSTTLFQDSAGTTPAVLDGDPVGKWADKSGTNNHATQPDPTDRPVLKVAIQNGRNGVLFSPATIHLDTANPSLMRNIPSATAIAVAQMPDAVNEHTIAVWTINTGTSMRFGLGARPATGAQYALAARRLDGDTASVASGSTVTDTMVLLSGTMNWQAQTQQVWLNGGIIADLSGVLTSGNTADTDSQHASIGGRSIGGTMLGAICELLIYIPALSNADRAIAEAYLNSKWFGP